MPGCMVYVDGRKQSRLQRLRRVQQRVVKVVDGVRDTTSSPSGWTAETPVDTAAFFAVPSPPPPPPPPPPDPDCGSGSSSSPWTASVDLIECVECAAEAAQHRTRRRRGGSLRLSPVPPRTESNHAAGFCTCTVRQAHTHATPTTPPVL